MTAACACWETCWFWSAIAIRCSGDWKGMKHSPLYACDMRRDFFGIIWADVSQRRISRTLQMIIMHGFPKREETSLNTMMPPKAFVQSILQNTLRIRARILMNGLRLSGVAIC